MGFDYQDIPVARKKTGREQIVFVVDEVGQYVAPRTDLMLNLDGLVRSLKEIGRGKVWFVATAQQTLNEIVARAILNSAELYRLRDRFPVGIALSPTDRTALVVSSNFDLAYNRGVVHAAVVGVTDMLRKAAPVDFEIVIE